jgi:hypothetical protein
LLPCWFAIALPMLLTADADAAPVDTGAAPALIPTPAPRQTVEPTDRRADRIDLKQANDGSGDLLYEASSFSARIAPDGSVVFEDKRVPGATPFAFMPQDVRMPVPSLQASLKPLLGGGKAPPLPPSELDEGLPPPETTSANPEVSRYRPDPREGCRSCGEVTQLGLPVQGFTRFDVTDELMRSAGEDPNRYQKAVFLAATQERRMQMAVDTQANNMRIAVAELPARLQAIACDERLTHEGRRAILVALAREMDTETSAGRNAATAIATFLTRFDAGTVGCVSGPSP